MEFYGREKKPLWATGRRSFPAEFGAEPRRLKVVLHYIWLLQIASYILLLKIEYRLLAIDVSLLHTQGCLQAHPMMQIGLCGGGGGQNVAPVTENECINERHPVKDDHLTNTA